jgi:hypothetical protein
MGKRSSVAECGGAPCPHCGARVRCVVYGSDREQPQVKPCGCLVTLSEGDRLLVVLSEGWRRPL